MDCNYTGHPDGTKLNTLNPSSLAWRIKIACRQGSQAKQISRSVRTPCIAGNLLVWTALLHVQMVQHGDDFWYYNTKRFTFWPSNLANKNINIDNYERLSMHPLTNACPIARKVITRDFNCKKSRSRAKCYF